MDSVKWFNGAGSRSWGDLGAADRQANDEARVHGPRILSVDHATNGTKFWLLTEHDRRTTPILLPEDY